MLAKEIRWWWINSVPIIAIKGQPQWWVGLSIARTTTYSKWWNQFISQKTTWILQKNKKTARFFSNHISCGRWVESIFYSSRDMNRLFFLFHSIPTICLKQRHLPFEFQSWNQTFWVVRSIVRFHSSKSKHVGKHVCNRIQTCFGWGNMRAAEFEQGDQKHVLMVQSWMRP